MVMHENVPDAAARSRSNEVPPIPPLISLLIVVLLGLTILYLIPRPQEISPPGWRLLAIFVCTILALMLRPMPTGAVVLTGLTLTVLAQVMTISQALSAYASGTVWLVLSAFFIARALISTGLARRIALFFVSLIGHTSLGLGYSILATDMVLGGIIPSNGARVGGVIFPITRTLATIYDSKPGRTAMVLGCYLMLTLYQGDIIVCAMFLTGQAGNPVGARLAEQTSGVSMTWASWLHAAAVPGLAAILLAPWIVYVLYPPQVKHTPRAAEMARRELRTMGRMGRDEKIAAGVFALVFCLWATSSLHGIDATTVALLGVAVLLVTGALAWKDALQEHVGWDVFVWYGGVVRLGEGLSEFGITSALADWASNIMAGWTWPVVTVVVILIYFYGHYAIASITTHFISLYPPFLSVLIAAGAPAPLAAYAMAFYTNLSASLTHYGTTPAPIVFAAGYVSHGDWWRTGLILSFVNLTVWSLLGLIWWRYIGLY